MRVTKEWQEIEFRMCTLVIPSIPGVRIKASETKPVGEVGILFSGKVEPFYSGQKLWAKLPSCASQESIEMTVENFI